MLHFERITYKHFGNCYRLSNDQIELLITSEIGPRIVRFGFICNENEFAEVGICLDQRPADRNRRRTRPWNPIA